MNACANCNQPTSQNQTRIQCDCCKQYLHVGCTGITDDKITRNKARALKIVCNVCNSKFEQLADIKGLIESLKADMNSKISSLEQKLHEIETKITSATQNFEIPRKSFEKVTVEAVERINRSRNIIIKGAPEATGTAEARKSADFEKVVEILSVIDSVDAPLSVNRLGRNVNGDRPRPLKVVFDNQSAARHVLRNKQKLLNNNTTKNFKISDDKTPSQIEYLNSVREELQERLNGGESNLTIKYINGLPEITKRQSKN